MAYSIAWNEAFPAGTSPAASIATYIQQTKTMVRERVDDIFGTSGVTSIENADPYLPILLKLSGSPTSRIIPGATSFSIRDSANARDNLLVSEAGDVTVYKNLRVDTGQGYIDRFSKGNITGAVTVDWNESNTQAAVLTGNVTFTFSNPVAGAFYTLELKQDATGSRLITWPASVVWASGVAPVLTTTAARTDIISFYYNGTNYIGIPAGYNFNV